GGKGNIRAIVAALADTAREFRCEPWENPWYFPSVGAYATLVERGGLEVDYAALFDRWTPLEGEQGLRDWLAMFANDALGRVPAGRQDEFLRHIEERLRPVLYRAGGWQADYRRLRVGAHTR